MSLKDSINKHISVLKAAFSKQTKEPVINTGLKKDSSNIIMRNDPPQKKGLKKNAIIALSAGVAVIAISMIVSGILSPGKKENNKDLAYETSTKNVKTPGQDIPTKYSDLPKYNQKTNIKPGQQPGQQPGQNGQPYNNSNNNYSPSQIQDSGYRSNNSSNANYGYINNANYSKNDEDNPINYISSAISFAFGNSTANASSNNSTTSQNYTTDLGYQKIAPNTLFAGTVIPATLITGINSDTAGDIVAQVRQNVYDSETGSVLLIPQGARLIGKYSNSGGTSNGQTRLNAMFSRIIFPNGYSINLDNQQGTDGSGYPGLSDQVDNHSAQVYRSAFLTTALSSLAGSASNGDGQENRSPGQEAVATGISNILNMSGKMMDKQMDVQPTIIIRPGTQFSVFLNKDLPLQEYQDY